MFVWEIECVLCVGYFGVGLGEFVCAVLEDFAVCGTILCGFFACRFVLCVGLFGVDLGE